MRADKESGRRRAARLVGLGLTVVGLLLPMLGQAAAEETDDAEDPKPKPPETWHATAYIRGRMGIRVIDYWSKGANMRARTLKVGS